MILYYLGRCDYFWGGGGGGWVAWWGVTGKGRGRRLWIVLLGRKEGRRLSIVLPALSGVQFLTSFTFECEKIDPNKQIHNEKENVGVTKKQSTTTTTKNKNNNKKEKTDEMSTFCSDVLFCLSTITTNYNILFHFQASEK